MTKKFYVFIWRSNCDPELSVCKEFTTSEEVETFLLDEGEFNRENVWIVFGERFGFKTIDKPVSLMLTGPEEPLARETLEKHP